MDYMCFNFPQSLQILFFFELIDLEFLKGFLVDCRRRIAINKSAAKIVFNNTACTALLIRDALVVHVAMSVYQIEYWKFASNTGLV